MQSRRSGAAGETVKTHSIIVPIACFSPCISDAVGAPTITPKCNSPFLQGETLFKGRVQSAPMSYSTQSELITHDCSAEPAHLSLLFFQVGVDLQYTKLIKLSKLEHARVRYTSADAADPGQCIFGIYEATEDGGLPQISDDLASKRVMCRCSGYPSVLVY